VGQRNPYEHECKISQPSLIFIFVVKNFFKKEKENVCSPTKSILIKKKGIFKVSYKTN